MKKMPWMFHLMAVHGADIDAISYETDRMQFIGRGNTVAAPQAMQGLGPLAGNQGSVLDPIVAIRYQITLDAEQSATIDMVTGIAESRDFCLTLIEKNIRIVIWQTVSSNYRGPIVRSCCAS
ncbi:hypothetical protein ACFS07_08220 [Undibacterium arcticum]